jgi:SAM-dependent methyltransferase
MQIGVGPDRASARAPQAAEGERMSGTRSVQPEYFEALYARNPDPWGFEGSAYERDKYADTLASLPRPRYASGLEVGCSIGMLTRELAGRCDRLLGVDLAEAALDQARRRNADLPHVAFARMRFPDERPAGVFDLVVFSEVLYYFDEVDLGRVASAALSLLAPHGDLVLVHWILENDCTLPGDVAVDTFRGDVRAATETLAQKRAERYRIDVLRRHG